MGPGMGGCGIRRDDGRRTQRHSRCPHRHSRVGGNLDTRVCPHHVASRNAPAVIPRSPPRHSRVGGNLDTRVCPHRPAPIITSFPRRRESGHAVLRRLSRGAWFVPPRVGGTDHAHSLTSGLLGRLPRGAGAEEGGSCGDEEGAGEEEHEEEAAGDAGAASSGELVGRNGRRGGRGR